MPKTFTQVSAELEAIQAEARKLAARVEALYSNGRMPEQFEAALRNAGMPESQAAEYTGHLRAFLRYIDEDIDGAIRQLGAAAHIVSTTDHKARRAGSSPLTMAGG
jgi:hypothetical protein